jgi:hypothetical protein
MHIREKQQERVLYMYVCVLIDEKYSFVAVMYFGQRSDGRSRGSILSLSRKISGSRESIVGKVDTKKKQRH